MQSFSAMLQMKGRQWLLAPSLACGDNTLGLQMLLQC